MRATDWIQLGSLIVAAIGLRYLIKYVAYTRQIAEQSVLQTEANSKPAIIAISGGSMDASPRLRNIGKGPALDVEWEVIGTNAKGKVDYVEPGHESDHLHGIQGAKTLVNGALKLGHNKPAIVCTYRSISGLQYRSVSNYDLERNRYSTTFADVR